MSEASIRAATSGNSSSSTRSARSAAAPRGSAPARPLQRRDALTWEIAAEDFEAIVVKQIRDADEIPLQLLLSRMTKAGERLIEDEAGKSDLAVA